MSYERFFKSQAEWDKSGFGPKAGDIIKYFLKQKAESLEETAFISYMEDAIWEDNGDIDIWARVRETFMLDMKPRVKLTITYPIKLNGIGNMSDNYFDEDGDDYECYFIVGNAYKIIFKLGAMPHEMRKKTRKKLFAIADMRDKRRKVHVLLGSPFYETKHPSKYEQ